jgi:pantoate kinase
MADKVKLVSESLQEWEVSSKKEVSKKTVEELNEGAKGLLQAFVKNPEKTKAFVAAFARQVGKVKGLKDALIKLSDESKIKVAKQALAALEDPQKGYPWIKIHNGKIMGAGALSVERKEGLVNSVGGQ